MAQSDGRGLIRLQIIMNKKELVYSIRKEAAEMEGLLKKNAGALQPAERAGRRGGSRGGEAGSEKTGVEISEDRGLDLWGEAVADKPMIGIIGTISTNKHG